MIDYYSNRAKEYEAIYHRDDPTRQKEQVLIQNKLKSICANKSIYEIACGTGYWTQFISESAKSITASDLSNEVIEIAKKKKYFCPITFENQDLTTLSSHILYDYMIGNFIFSHIKKDKIKNTMEILKTVLHNGSELFFSDNVYIEGIGGVLVQCMNENTYKIRTLKDGTEHKILKNYYIKPELVNMFKSYGTIKEVFYGKCFWYILLRMNIN